MRLALFLLVAFAITTRAFTIAENGRARCVIVREIGAPLPERNAVAELAGTLEAITGAKFEIVERAPAKGEPAILVGSGPVVQELFPELQIERFGPEEIVMKTRGDVLLLGGGRPRGVLYAVNRFLQEQCGVRWWTPWATNMPVTTTLKVGELNLREKPAFEYREPYWYPAFDTRWAVRNCVNGQSGRIPAEWGDCIRYKGFVHTFYPLVPTTNFAAHPEWFSEIKGRRTTNHAQLCLTNPKLRDFVVGRVKEWLRKSEARIVSVSQNDWQGWCECAECKAVDDREGSHAGTMIDFVNHVAEKIEPEFPQVAMDTLAYQYTRKPPRMVKPRANVIVRLCSIECNFREPLTHESNAKFADDIRGWEKICDRLYIWDYTTDFAHYVQPHPNWFVLGDNLRFFQAHHVRGVFEQGAYQSHGSEMAEMRAWVLAQLLWNPQQDDRKLIREFLDGYYGTNAAPFIWKYFELMHEASHGHNLTCYSGTDAPFLRFKQMVEAEKLWHAAEGEARAGGDSEHQARLALGRLPLTYVWLRRSAALRAERVALGAQSPLVNRELNAALRRGVPDPDIDMLYLHSVERRLADSVAARARLMWEFRTICLGVHDKPWTKVTLLSEGGLTPAKFLDRYSVTNGVWR
jgi:hypothetical protein